MLAALLDYGDEAASSRRFASLSAQAGRLGGHDWLRDTVARLFGVILGSS